MRALVFLGEVKLPVVVEVATRAQGAQAQDGFGADERPARAGAAHPILHEVSARALDHARRDRQPVGERAVVVQEPRVLDEVLASRVCSFGSASAALRVASRRIWFPWQRVPWADGLAEQRPRLGARSILRTARSLCGAPPGHPGQALRRCRCDPAS
jgi:hypothetical protein